MRRDRVLLYLRAILLGVALSLFVASWLVGYLPEKGWKTLHNSAEALRAWATFPTVLYLLIEAIANILKRVTDGRRDELLDIADSAMAELEESCVRASTSPRIYHCSVAVWRVAPKRWWQFLQSGSDRPLEIAFRKRMRNKRSRTGVSWRTDKGVIGMAVADGQTRIVDVDALWSPLLQTTPDEWANQPDSTRMGLSHEEFLQAALRTGVYVGNAAGPAILAVPIVSKGKVVGCAALDCPPSMVTAMQSYTLQALVYSLGVRALGVSD